MSNDAIVAECSYLDDLGNPIYVASVDLRDPADRTLIQTLIKGCETRYAIELCKRVRISKPPVFRKYGEGLIKDLEEGYMHRGTLVFDRTDDPDAQTEDQSIGDEFVRASQLSQTPLRVVTQTKGHIRLSHEYSPSLDLGRKGWIFCASIAPSTQ